MATGTGRSDSIEPIVISLADADRMETLSRLRAEFESRFVPADVLSAAPEQVTASQARIIHEQLQERRDGRTMQR